MGSSPTRGSSFFSRKSDCLGCAVLLCLLCLFDLASFFLPSHLSFKNMYITTYVYMHLGSRLSVAARSKNDYSLSSVPHEFRRERKPDFAEEESVGLLKALWRGRRD